MTNLEVVPITPFHKETEVGTAKVVDAETNEEVFARFGDYWSPDYSLYQRPELGLTVMQQKFRDVAQLLQEQGHLSAEQVEAELATSLTTVERFYDEWTSQDKLGDGSFAFMVPTRAERLNGFAPEYKPFYPLIQHLGPRLGQLMLVGTPPFIVDKYHRGENGDNRQGVMLFAPIFGDMMQDLPPEELEPTFNRAIEDAIVFARDRFGVSSVGLGAILPAVTNFGRSINVEGVKTTTGHGGTIHLINETINAAAQRGSIDPDISKIGVIGLGSIGASVASVVSAEFPGSRLVLNDTNPNKVSRTIEALGLPDSRYEVAETSLGLMAMADCKVIICATTTPIRIPEQVYPAEYGLDRLIIDDSQPTAVNPIEASNNAGANVVWPIGKSRDKRLHRESFDYGDLGPIDKGVWGCEAEAFATWVNPDLALREPVTPESARRISAAAKNLGISAAELQCFGRFVK